jgi:hypothetical protein
VKCLFSFCWLVRVSRQKHYRWMIEGLVLFYLKIIWVIWMVVMLNCLWGIRWWMKGIWWNWYRIYVGSWSRGIVIRSCNSWSLRLLVKGSFNRLMNCWCNASRSRIGMRDSCRRGRRRWVRGSRRIIWGSRIILWGLKCWLMYILFIFYLALGVGYLER